MKKPTSFILAAALFAAACGGSTPESEMPADGAAAPGPAGEGTPVNAPADSQATATFESQVSAGGPIYVAKCAGCHGDAGQGTEKGAQVVGEGALPLKALEGRKRNVEFRTAMDVFAWVKQTMPPDAPGSLSDQEYVEVLAFALNANGVKLEEPLGAGNAASVVLHE